MGHILATSIWLTREARLPLHAEIVTVLEELRKHNNETY